MKGKIFFVLIVVAVFIAIGAISYYLMDKFGKPPATNPPAPDTSNSNSLVGKPLTYNEQIALIKAREELIKYGSKYSSWVAATYNRLISQPDFTTNYANAVRVKAKQTLIDEGYLITV